MLDSSVVDVTERLTSLTLVGVHVQRDDMEQLAPHLTRLTEIAAPLRVMDQNALIALLRSDVGPRLRRIDIEWDWGPELAPAAPGTHPIGQAFAHLAARNPRLREVNPSVRMFLPSSMGSVQTLKLGDSPCLDMILLLNL